MGDTAGASTKVITRMAQSDWFAVLSRLAVLAAPAVLTWAGSAVISTAKEIQTDLATIKTTTALYGQRLDTVEKKLGDVEGVTTEQAVTRAQLDNMRAQLDKIERIVAETQRRSEVRDLQPTAKYN